MTSIFLSYRREDSRHQAGRLHDRLVTHFGQARVFKDVDSIPLGWDFREILTERVAACDVFLAVISDGWLSADGPGGTRRLDDPGDFVRIEIEAALSRNILVIPVLVGNKSVPRAEELPESMRGLSFRNGLPVRPDPDFHKDMDRLIRGIEQGVIALRQRPAPRPPTAQKPEPKKSAEPPLLPTPEPVTSPEPLPDRPRTRWPSIVAATFLGVFLLGVIIYVATDKGRIKIEVNDPNVVVFVDGKNVQIEGVGESITLRTGEHQLSIKRGDVEVKTQDFVIRRGDNPVLKVVLESVPPAPPIVDGSLITNALGMKLKLIPAGEFAMGSDASDPDARDDEKVNGQKHQVRITKPFYLGTTEVTVGQFRKFVEATSYKTEAEKDGKGDSWRSPGFKQEDDHPVVYVSWNDAKAFCDWLSRKEGKTYRLPTEAEWEYSCRAGRTTRYSSGDNPKSLAKYLDEEVGPVGRFQRNDFDLYDMHGNVAEWCSDWYDSDYYSISLPADPENSSVASVRVFRGMCGYVNLCDMRSASRFKTTPKSRGDCLGFRVTRVQ